MVIPKFDLVIANPPYGHNSTLAKSLMRSVMEHNVAEDYLILMPTAGYRDKYFLSRVTSDKPMKYTWNVDNALIETTACVLHNDPVNKWASFEEFREQMFDPRFVKYYKANRMRPDVVVKYFDGTWGSEGNFNPDDWDVNTTLIFNYWARRDGPTADFGFDRAWNVNHDKTFQPARNGKPLRKRGVLLIQFNTPAERNNYRDFWYRRNLSLKICQGAAQAYASRDYWIPRVDWSHAWTDEQILMDYGFTPAEVGELLG